MAEDQNWMNLMQQLDPGRAKSNIETPEIDMSLLARSQSVPDKAITDDAKSEVSLLNALNSEKKPLESLQILPSDDLPTTTARKMNFEVKSMKAFKLGGKKRKSFCVNEKFLAFENKQGEIEILLQRDFSVRGRIPQIKSEILDMALHSKSEDSKLAVLTQNELQIIKIIVLEDQFQVTTETLSAFKFESSDLPMQIKFKDESTITLAVGSELCIFSLESNESKITDTQALIKFDPQPTNIIKVKETVRDYCFSTRKNSIIFVLEHGKAVLVDVAKDSASFEFKPLHTRALCVAVLNYAPIKRTAEEYFIFVGGNGDFTVRDLNAVDPLTGEYRIVDQESSFAEKSEVIFSQVDSSMSFLFIGKKDLRNNDCVVISAYHFSGQVLYQQNESILLDHCEKFLIQRPQPQNLNVLGAQIILKHDEDDETPQEEKKENEIEKLCNAKTIFQIFYQTQEALNIAAIGADAIYPGYESGNKDFVSSRLNTAGNITESLVVNQDDISPHRTEPYLEDRTKDNADSSNAECFEIDYQSLATEAGGYVFPEEKKISSEKPKASTEEKTDRQLEEANTGNVKPEASETVEKSTEQSSEPKKTENASIQDGPYNVVDQTSEKMDTKAKHKGGANSGSKSRGHGEPKITYEIKVQPQPAGQVMQKQEDPKAGKKKKGKAGRKDSEADLIVDPNADKGRQQNPNKKGSQKAGKQEAGGQKQNPKASENFKKGTTEYNVGEWNYKNIQEEQDPRVQGSQMRGRPQKEHPEREWKEDEYFEKKEHGSTNFELLSIYFDKLNKECMNFIEEKFDRMEEIIDMKVNERMNRWQQSFNMNEIYQELDDRMAQLFTQTFDTRVVPSIEQYLVKMFGQIGSVIERGQKYYMDKLNSEQAKAEQLRESMDQLVNSFTQISLILNTSTTKNQSTANQIDQILHEKSSQILTSLEQVTRLMQKQEQLQQMLETTEKGIFNTLNELKNELGTQLSHLSSDQGIQQKNQQQLLQNFQEQFQGYPYYYQQYYQSNPYGYQGGYSGHSNQQGHAHKKLQLRNKPRTEGKEAEGKGSIGMNVPLERPMNVNEEPAVQGGPNRLELEEQLKRMMLGSKLEDLKNVSSDAGGR